MRRHYFFKGLDQTVRGYVAAMETARATGQVLIGPQDLELISVVGLFVKADPDVADRFVSRYEDLLRKRRIPFAPRPWAPAR